jgi:rubrerythrin
MQHLGWLAEEMVGISGTPRIEHTEIDKSIETPDMLKADITIENKVAAEYDRAAREVEDTGLKELFIRLRDHEVYHAEVFTDLLEEEES